MPLAAATDASDNCPIRMSKSRRRSPSRSRDGNPPEFFLLASPSQRGGRRECRVQAAPMARLQQKKQAAVTTGKAGTSRHSLRDGFTAYTCAPRSPGLLASVALRNHHPQNLIPASGDQDYTTSPSVGMPPSTRHARRHPAVHRIPSSTFVTIAKRPSG